ncbi:Neuropilin and tolloid-like protein 2 [Triplophysa tibetana]|uniref:Neuropilin and tolloid-like protein 2 n=1 Tax=Triplophysa tibetana TaxID=1572043 RepID=A0A5A9NY88_9TELE|nr:Neuropilin and tolloid-like protein 2 [Triplophysa tibetana]
MQEALPQNVAIEDKKPAHCGTLIQTANGGSFSSPNYPKTYPANKECVYILEAHPRKRIQLVFDDLYYIEPSFECRFDNIEIRDGPFAFSPLINRFCDCQFDLSGSDGIIRSSQVEEENKVKSGEAIDCIWTIRAPPMSKNFVAIYEGSNAIEDLKAKFCSTVANDITLDNAVGVVRMWADENSKLSRFRMIFTVFVEPTCASTTRWSVMVFRTVCSPGTRIIAKVLNRKSLFSAAEMQEVLEPPHYELFSMREPELSDELSEELDTMHKLRRSSNTSRCIHEHHCGMQGNSSSVSMATRAHQLAQASEEMSGIVGARGWSSFHESRDVSRPHTRSVQSLREVLEDGELGLEERVMEEIGYNDVMARGGGLMMRNHANPVQQRSLSIDF